MQVGIKYCGGEEAQLIGTHRDVVILRDMLVGPLYPEPLPVVYQLIRMFQICTVTS